MDIYSFAKVNNTDYYDTHTGYTYLVQDYNNAIRLGLPTPGIGVLDATGTLIGYARKNGSCSEEGNSVSDVVPTSDTKHVPKQAVWMLESEISSHAPENIRKWFDSHEQFIIINSTSFRGIFVTAYDPNNGVQQKSSIAIPIELAESRIDFRMYQRKGGNINAQNGGYSICVRKVDDIPVTV